MQRISERESGELLYAFDPGFTPRRGHDPMEDCGPELCERLGGVTHPIRLTRGGGPGLTPVQVPAGQYLVMGDNRGNSEDGRLFGFVRREDLYGRVVAVFLRDGRPTWRSV